MIRLQSLTLRRGVKVVLKDAQVVLNPGEKASLVGRNGAGKSSLFALLAGRLHADAGDVEIPAKWRMGEVAQHMPETDQSATEFVLEGDTVLQAAYEQLANAEAQEDGHAIADAHVALQDASAFDARPRAQALLLGLGFQRLQLDAPVNSFSGGWRMRLQLARALMCPSDLLLLDEPTNHLDLDALVWLEAWLQRYPGTLLVISHDREFLDAITQVTLHLDDAQLTRYGGNYSTFEEMRAERLSQQASAFVKQQDKISQLQRFIDRFKAKATKAKQAQSRVKALARMERIAPVLTASDFAFNFREPANLPNPMLAMRDLQCGYGPEAIIVRGINRSVLAGQRIGILGANGQGKSTLVKTIARSLPIIDGELVEGKGLAIGYFAQQEMDLLDAESSPLEHMVRLAKVVSPQAREQELRDFLGQFRFVAEMVHQPVGTLSGGEKARLVLAIITWQRPNLLLLDEPTNHLDLSTREALSMALNEFEGTVMLVSHDRALLREVCDEFWLVTHGGVQPFDGDLDDYQRWLLDVSKAVGKGQSPPLPPNSTLESQEPPSVVPKGPSARSAKPSPDARVTSAPQGPNGREARESAKAARAARANQSRPLRMELQSLDLRMERLSKERAEAEAAWGSGGLSADAFAEHGRRLAHVQAELAMLEERWLEVSESLEALSREVD